jgi:hypothetical protein
MERQRSIIRKRLSGMAFVVIRLPLRVTRKGPLFIVVVLGMLVGQM